MVAQAFDVAPITARIGAQIHGLNLKEDLSADTVRDLRTALLAHKVLFFRSQNLDAAEHLAFARRFGQVTLAHPTVSSFEQDPHILDLNFGKGVIKANVWHTDVSFIDRPPMGSVLRAVVVPEVGGDTVWANTAAAYSDLPAHLKTLAENLRAVHSNAFDYFSAGVDISNEEKQNRAIFTSTVYETCHPVVCVHPETSERTLLLGSFVRQFRGLSSSESHDTQRMLQFYVTRQENIVRWRWKQGDVAFWDNRATQHYAIADYGELPRRTQRITLAGSQPVSVNGWRSESIQGDASGFSQSASA